MPNARQLARSGGKGFRSGNAFFCIVTAGGGESAYHQEGFNRHTLRELLAPLEQTATLCGMHYLPPLAMFGARTAREEGRIEKHAKDCARMLVALREDRLDLDAAAGKGLLNESLALLEGTSND